MRSCELTVVESEGLDNIFESVTEDEIISLWESFRASGLTKDDAWNAIVMGIGLDMAFGRSRSLPKFDH